MSDIDQGILPASGTPEQVSTQPTETERSDADMIVPKMSIPKPWRGKTKTIAASRFVFEYPKLVRSNGGYHAYIGCLPESTVPQAAPTTGKTAHQEEPVEKLVGEEEGTSRGGLSRVGGILGECPIRLPKKRKRNVFDMEDDEEEEDEDDDAATLPKRPRLSRRLFD